MRDGQENMCILIIYGDSEVATENELLGQFDIVGIPKAPMEVPRLQAVPLTSPPLVSSHLSHCVTGEEGS